MENEITQELLDQEEDTQRGNFLTFSLGNEFYGLEICYVMEIIGIQPITEVPELPDYMRGIINLRGKIIPVMDVRLRFRKPFREYGDRTCVVVIEIMGISVGLIVDSVAEVMPIREEDIVQPREIKAVHNRYIKGIGKVGSEVKLLLDCEKLLNDDEINSISSAV